MQGGVVEFWIMGQQDKCRACIKAYLFQRVIRPIRKNAFAGKARLGPEGAARAWFD